MKLVVGNQRWQRAASCYIRLQVFVLEQKIPLEEEFDAHDLDETIYAVLYDENKPAATGRFLQEGTTARLTRIATLPEYRKQHLGSQIIEALEVYALSQGLKKASIHADLTALPFYQKLGYVPYGEVYLEDGVPCQSLEKEF
ncbi:GNAT family N-acetyltransferase [Enterococcus massiliensis]|uniref:GNAT family N-acetyltransferase n=1 Tax=Enterococcus massiliensis TaxID=1640685 RepID=UPI00065E4FDD|nr:GNAT family N-acetyltransferase [Enterococcus massiliensis]